MNTDIKSTIGIVLGVVAIALAILSFTVHMGPSFGNTTQSFVDAKQGYKVNGTAIVSSSRALSNITTGSFSSSVGVASTSPFSTLGVGSTGATSTIAGGTFCMYFKDEAGRAMYIKLATSGNNVFASSTSPCNQ